MSNPRVTLVGDGIKNPHNVRALLDCAGMFDVACRFRDVGGHDAATITAEALQALHPSVIAFDTLAGAREVYGFRAGSDFAVVVGNERRGLSREARAVATDAVYVPMHARGIDTLNVAAAAAVALYYLRGTRVPPMAPRRRPESRRPELLLVGAGDHVELGSAVRSAAAFGWARALVEDREGVWFGVERAARAEGRAAARWARNHIRLVPCSTSTGYGFDGVTVVSGGGTGVPLHRCDLARGPRHAVLIADERHVRAEHEDWSRVGHEVRLAHLDLPPTTAPHRYRLTATIALAEIARQIGKPVPKHAGARRRRLDYELALRRGPDGGGAGDVVGFDELMGY